MKRSIFYLKITILLLFSCTTENQETYDTFDENKIAVEKTRWKTADISKEIIEN